MKNVCGILGGLGAESTARFYVQLIQACAEIKESAHRPAVVIWNLPLTYEDEEHEIMHGKYGSTFLPLLIDGAQRLKNAGATFLALPCNSAHLFHSAIDASSSIPLLHIIKETVSAISEKKVGLLTSLVTAKHTLYQPVLKRKNIECILPSEQDQNSLNRIVFNQAVQMCSEKDKKTLSEIVVKMTGQGAQAIILGCAALAPLLDNILDVKLYDSMDLYVQAACKKLTE